MAERLRLLQRRPKAATAAAPTRQGGNQADDALDSPGTAPDWALPSAPALDARFGHNFAQVSVFPPGNVGPSISRMPNLALQRTLDLERPTPDSPDNAPAEDDALRERPLEREQVDRIIWNSMVAANIREAGSEAISGERGGTEARTAMTFLDISKPFIVAQSARTRAKGDDALADRQMQLHQGLSQTQGHLASHVNIPSMERIEFDLLFSHLPNASVIGASL